MISKYQLVMQAGPTPGKIYELDQDIVLIGRETGNAVVITDPEISRKHSRLVLQPGGYLLEDMGSTNGTFVNNQRLMGPHLLKHGEIIGLGDNVALAFEQMQFDPDATMVSPATFPTAPAPEPYQPAQPAAPQPVYQQPPAQPAYQQPPAQPVYQQPPAQPVYQQPPVQPVYQQPAYSAPAPAYPAEAYAPPAEAEFEPEEEKKKPRTWLIAGIGCLLVLLCVIGGAAFAFDSLNLYCTPPFDVMFACP